MFDIGFWELTLIGVVALLVVGPDRLPRMARTVGLWVGRMRRYVSQVRSDIEREIDAEEMRSLTKEPEMLSGLRDAVKETASALRDARSSMSDLESKMNIEDWDDLDDAPDDLEEAAATRPAGAAGTAKSNSPAPAGGSGNRDEGAKTPGTAEVSIASEVTADGADDDVRTVTEPAATARPAGEPPGDLRESLPANPTGDLEGVSSGPPEASASPEPEPARVKSS